jgi:hypothetical protein
MSRHTRVIHVGAFSVLLVLNTLLKTVEFVGDSRQIGCCELYAVISLGATLSLNATYIVPLYRQGRKYVSITLTSMIYARSREFRACWAQSIEPGCCFSWYIVDASASRPAIVN